MANVYRSRNLSEFRRDPILSFSRSGVREQGYSLGVFKTRRPVKTPISALALLADMTSITRCVSGYLAEEPLGASALNAVSPALQADNR
jgi:hypothetical protein